MPDEDSRVIQVSNLSPTVTKEQMKALFGFIGKIDDIHLYPEELSDVLSRVCFVRFRDSEDIGVSLHLTNTVFVDRPLIVVPVPDGKIPDETAALGLLDNPSALDPSAMYAGLAQYPALPASTELSKVEEIRRTVYASGVDSAISGEALMQFFGQAGEVKYIRMAGEEGQAVRSAFVEYTDQVSVVKALSLSGQVFAGRQLHVTPSNNAIAKPVAPGLNATSREIEEAMRKVNEAQPLIAAAVDPDANGRRTRSKSRSSRHRSSRSHRSRSRHSSRSRSRRSRSRKRSSSRSYKDSRSRRKSQSPSRRKSRSPKRRKSRSKSKERTDRKRHRSKSRSPRPSKSRKSRSPSRGKRRRSRSGSKTKGREAGSKKSKSRSHSPSIPKLEKEVPSSSELEHSSKKRKPDLDESSSSRKESSRRRSRTPKKSPKKSRSKSKSPRGSSRKDKPHESSRDGDRKGSDRDRERDKDRDSKRERDSRREKERSPEKKREAGDRASERESRKERERSRERNRSRERREAGGDGKSSRHRDKDQEVEEKSRKVKRDYDEEEKSLVGVGVEEKSARKPESEKEDSDHEERPPSSGRRAHEGSGGAPPDTNLTTMDMDVDSE